MDSLSGISEYLRTLDDMFKDTGSSLEKIGGILEESKKELGIDTGDMEEVCENKVQLPKNKRVVVFTQAPSTVYDSPMMRFGTPCEVEGVRAWDAQLNMAYGENYILEEVLDEIGHVRMDYEAYGRKMVKNLKVNIHGHIFETDFVVLEEGNADEPNVCFGRDFLVTTKCQVDFGMGEMRINITELEEGKGVNEMLVEVCANMEEKEVEVVKMGKANRKKPSSNKLTPTTTSTTKNDYTPSSPTTTIKPLTDNQKEAILENLEQKFLELNEKKPVIEVLQDYVLYRKKLDALMLARARLEDKNLTDEERDRILFKGMPRKEKDPGNFVLPIKVNGTTPVYALADTGSSVNVMPYPLFKTLGLSNPQPNHSKLTMADNTQAKAMGEVKNVRVQIGYQPYLADFLVLDIPVDKSLPLLLGRPFLRTCGAIIDMGRGTMTIDDGISRQTYYPKPRGPILECMEDLEWMDANDDLTCFEVGRDVHGNPMYGPLTPPYFDIEDEMERAFAIEAFYNPFKNILVYKKLTDFLGSLPVQLKNLEWKPEGLGTYKRQTGDGAWHVKFDILCPDGRRFMRKFKTFETFRELTGKFQSEDILRQEYFEEF